MPGSLPSARWMLVVLAWFPSRFGSSAAILASGPASVSAQRIELVLQTGGHREAVKDIAISPDQRWIATASLDHSVKIWDVATGRELRSLAAGEMSVTAIAISPDGTWMASGDLNGQIDLWDVASGRRIGRVPNPSGGGVTRVVFSPNGRWLAAATLSGQVFRWSLTTGELLAPLDKLSFPAQTIAVSPDSDRIAYGGGAVSGEVKALQLSTGQQITARTRSPVWSLAFHPSLPLLAVGLGWIASGSIRLLWCDTGWELEPLEGHKGPVTSVSFGARGRLLASGSADKTVRLWDFFTGGERQVFKGHSSDVLAVALSPDEEWLVSGSHGAEAMVWAVGSGKPMRRMARRTTPLKGIAISPDGRWLAAGSQDARVRLWDLGSGGPPKVLVGHSKPVINVAFSSDGHRLASHSLEDRQVMLWDLTTAREICTIDGPTAPISFGAFGHWLASGDGNIVRLWDAVTCHRAGLLEGHTAPVTAVVSSPNGRLLASASMDLTVRVWDVVRSRALHTLAGHSRPVLSVAFSPDARVLASTSIDGTVRLWNVATGREERNLVGGAPHSIYAVTFSPDGQLLAWAHADRVALWDRRTAQVVRELEGHAAVVTGLEFDRSGRCLISSSRDGTARVWDVHTGIQLGTLVSFDRTDDWLVVTPDGLFDGSPAAWRSVAWRPSPSTFDVNPVEAYFNERFYPGLLSQLLGGTPPRAHRAIAEIDRRQPGVTVQLPNDVADAPATLSSRTAVVRIEVKDAEPTDAHPSRSGARDLRLFRNGSLVKVWRGDVLKGAPKVTLEASIPIVAGENRFTAYCFNRDNVKSADAELVVTGTDSLKRSGTAHILAVGVNQYANPDYNLKYAVADAQAFAQELWHQQAKLGTFGSIEVIPLLDQSATKANILLALQRLAGTHSGPSPASAPADIGRIKPSQPEDAVFLYYAGHGTAQGPRFYLIPHDLGYMGPRAALDAAGLKTILAHSISDLDLEQAFETLDAGWMLLVIDACSSGQALEAEEKRRGPMNSKGLAQLAYEKGMNILTAAQGYQAAIEAARLGHGYLTYALVEEGLKTLAADTAPEDGQVVLREWLDYATQRVPQMQMAMMQDSRKLGREIAFVEGEEKVEDVEKRSLQRPRVFYRREPEARPLVVARPESGKEDK